MENQIQTAQHKANSLTTFTPQLRALLPIISEPAQAVVIARHSGTMFKEMTMDERFHAAGVIIADLKLFSGLKIPTDKSFNRMAILLAECLKEDYPHYTRPLVLIAIKKCANVLTTGKEKSYGRELSITDFNQVMDEYAGVVQDADKEVEEILNRQVDEKILSEDDKQNLIRKSIQERYAAGDYDCTYADFNQLLRDNILTEEACKKTAYNALKSVREKYVQLSNSLNGKEIRYDGKGNVIDVGSLKGVVEKRNVQEKLQLLNELENEMKAETASLYLKWADKSGIEIIYKQA